MRDDLKDARKQQRQDRDEGILLALGNLIEPIEDKDTFGFTREGFVFSAEWGGGGAYTQALKALNAGRYEGPRIPDAIAKKKGKRANLVTMGDLKKAIKYHHKRWNDVMCYRLIKRSDGSYRKKAVCIKELYMSEYDGIEFFHDGEALHTEVTRPQASLTQKEHIIKIKK